MSAEVGITGVNQFVGRLEEALGSSAIAEGLERAGNAVREEAERSVRDNGLSNSVAERLARQLRVAVRPGEAIVSVTSEDLLGHMLELGGHRQSSRPWLQPALASAAPDVPAILAAALQDALFRT